MSFTHFNSSLLFFSVFFYKESNILPARDNKVESHLPPEKRIKSEDAEEENHEKKHGSTLSKLLKLLSKDDNHSKKQEECIDYIAELKLAIDVDSKRKILREALDSSPISSNSKYWLSLALFEEIDGDSCEAPKIIERALKCLADDGVEINRNEWIENAIEMEKLEAVECCQAIINSIHGVDSQSRNLISSPSWMEEAKKCSNKNAYVCTRAMYSRLLSAYPSEQKNWHQAIFYEVAYETTENLEQLMEIAVKNCPNDEIIIFLIRAKIYWNSKCFAASQYFFNKAFKISPDLENTLFSIISNFSLEHEKYRLSEYDYCIDMFSKPESSRLHTENRIMKFIKDEWSLNNLSDAMNLLELSVEKFPLFPKFWMMKGQIETEKNELDAAAKTFDSGIKLNPNSIPMWLLLSELEENRGRVTRARSILEKAKSQNPKNVSLLIASVRLEKRADEIKMVRLLLSRALQELPTSGQLWSELISIENRSLRRTRTMDALRKCGDDFYIFLAVAKLFWSEGRIPTAHKWFNKTVEFNPDYGDAWAYFYKFEKLFGSHNEVMKRCVAADPKHGEEWCKFRKHIKNCYLTIEETLEEIIKTLPIPI